MLLNILLHDPRQLTTIASHTPRWVWVLLAGLLLLGASQLRARRMSRLRAGAAPLAMALFSFFGMVSAFWGSAQLDVAVGLWVVACAACMGLLLWRARPAPTGVRFDPATRTCEIPGSAIPLILIIGIFLTKYAVGIELALQGNLINDSHFVWSLASLYGLFSGAFLARGWRLWRLIAASIPMVISPLQPNL